MGQNHSTFALNIRPSALRYDTCARFRNEIKVVRSNLLHLWRTANNFQLNSPFLYLGFDSGIDYAVRKFKKRLHALKKTTGWGFGVKGTHDVVGGSSNSCLSLLREYA